MQVRAPKAEVWAPNGSPSEEGIQHDAEPTRGRPEVETNDVLVAAVIVDLVLLAAEPCFAQ